VRSMLALVWEVGVMPAEESAFDSGKGITTIEIRKAAPLIAATAIWATGLTGSMAVVSLPFKSTPSYRSWPWSTQRCCCSPAAIGMKHQENCRRQAFRGVMGPGLEPRPERRDHPLVLSPTADKLRK